MGEEGKKWIVNDERGQKAVAPGTQKGRPRNDNVPFQREGNQRRASGTQSSKKTCRAQAAPPWGRSGAAQPPPPAEGYRGAVGAAPFGVSPKVSPRV